VTSGIHVLFSNVEEVRREPAGEMWCFHCRKRLPHAAVVFAPVDKRSYYGPSWRYECPRCKHDYTSFPGCERSYEFEDGA
jgi:hypothetical protein